MFYSSTLPDTGYRSASQINSAMLRVYNYMLLAVITSMITGLAVASSPALLAAFFGPVTKWITIFAPLVFVFIVPMAINSGVSKGGALALLLLFAATMGLSLGGLFAVYTGLSIVSAFMGAAVLFATMSVYGYFTKTSLEGWGRWLFIAVIAILIISVVNIFIGSTVLQTVVSAVAVLVFTALTAYDTQRIREDVSVAESDHRPEILGALSLYLDFINIFVSLLQLFGSKDD